MHRDQHIGDVPQGPGTLVRIVVGVLFGDFLDPFASGFPRRAAAVDAAGVHVHHRDIIGSGTRQGPGDEQLQGLHQFQRQFAAVARFDADVCGQLRCRTEQAGGPWAVPFDHGVFDLRDGTQDLGEPGLAGFFQQLAPLLSRGKNVDLGLHAVKFGRELGGQCLLGQCRGGVAVHLIGRHGDLSPHDFAARQPGRLQRGLSPRQFLGGETLPPQQELILLATRRHCQPADPRQNSQRHEQHADPLRDRQAAADRAQLIECLFPSIHVGRRWEKGDVKEKDRHRRAVIWLCEGFSELGCV